MANEQLDLDKRNARLSKQSLSPFNMADALDWHISIQNSTVANDSDLTFTVGSGKQWIPISIALTYISTTGSTAVANSTSDRQVEVQIRSTGNNVLYSAVPGVTQALSSTRSYYFAGGVPDAVAFRDTDKITTPLPGLLLDSGYDIRIFDNKTRHSTGDDLTVRLVVLERDNPLSTQ